MDKESFAALLEEAKNNVGSEYLLNGMLLYYSNDRWTFESRKIIFGFDEFIIEGEGVSIRVGGRYLGIIDPREIRRVE